MDFRELGQLTAFAKQGFLVPVPSPVTLPIAITPKGKKKVRLVNLRDIGDLASGMGGAAGLGYLGSRLAKKLSKHELAEPTGAVIGGISGYLLGQLLLSKLIDKQKEEAVEDRR
jgi:hypothetical protein